MKIRSLRRRVATALVVPAAAIVALASARAEPARLAAAYEGNWENVEVPANGTMRITVDKVDDTGTVVGSYARDARFCATQGLAFKGRLDGATLEVVPDFGSDFRCKDTRWSFTLQSDGSLTGTGQSYFQLKASLKPVAK